MAFIIEVRNALDPLRDIAKHVHPGGVTIRQWLEAAHPGFVEFSVPTVCIVNGAPVLRKDWNQEIKEKDIVNFIAVPEGVEWVVAFVIVAVLLVVVMYMVTPTPVTPGQTPTGNPVFTIQGQQNGIRLGEPIEVCYGRNRIYPSLAGRPYYQYIHNDQFQYMLLCLGQGTFDVASIKIGDTAIGEYESVQYEICPPGVPVTIFPTNVYTSGEAGGQTLFAQNEVEYTGAGFVGAFSASPSGTTCTKIEIDLVMPKGLYELDKKGAVLDQTINYELWTLKVDDDGNPFGGTAIWTKVPNNSSNPGYITAATLTPQRRTFSHTVPQGRYMVKARRTSDKNKATTAGNDLVWEGMRSYLQTTDHYGNVTILAVRIKATNNLNSNSQRAFNVIATRKIPVYAGGVWTVAASRSIVWAFVDVFKSLYGGRVEDDFFFDLEALSALDTLYTSRGEHFDWVFRDPITVWDAARAIARAGRAVPMLVGSLITMKRDGPLEIPVTLFSPDNMRKGSFSWEIKLWDVVQNDSIRAEYTEVSTGYKQEQVIAVLPGGTSNNPRDVRLSGIQDRAHAYHEAMYMLASERYIRENISFETGLEGYIPSFGDLIAVAHDVPRWGQSGFVVHAVAGTGGSWTVWLSEPMDWSEPGVHQIMFRKKNSDLLGPFTATRTTDDSQVVVSLLSSVDFLLGGETEPMLFLFGVAGSITKYAKVVLIEPQGGEIIKVVAVNDAPLVHTYDGLTPPALNVRDYPPPPLDLPVIAFITLTQTDAHTDVVQVFWSPAVGAQYYVVESSRDGVNYKEEGTTVRTSIQLQKSPGMLWVRVAGVNFGQGPWKEGTLNVTYFISLYLFLPWTADEWGISWNDVAGADDYIIRVYSRASVPPALKSTITQNETKFIYTHMMQQDDANVVTTMLVTVDARFSGEGEGGSPASLELNQVGSDPIFFPPWVNPDGYRVGWYFIILFELYAGSPPIEWGLAPGSDPLPTGTTLHSATGTFEGVPADVGTFNLIFRATNTDTGAYGDGAIVFKVIPYP